MTKLKTIEVITIDSFRKGYKNIMKDLKHELNNPSTTNDSKDLINYFIELLDDNFSTSDILPFE